MRKHRINYSAWKCRILPILEVSGWNSLNLDGSTFMVNRTIGQRFEYRYYGNSAPIWIGPLEVVD